MIKALLIDKLPEEPKADHFIFQEGEDPIQLKGPISLPNLQTGAAMENLALDADGKVIKSNVLNTVVDSLQSQFEMRMAESLKNGATRAIENVLQDKREAFKRGEFFGFRLQALEGIPENSGNHVGRLILNLIDEKIYVDLGYKMKRVSHEKFERDFPNTSGLLTIDLSDSDIDDARKAVWQVRDNMDDFKVIPCEIKTPNEKTVVIRLPDLTGSYRVLGVE